MALIRNVLASLLPLGDSCIAKRASLFDDPQKMTMATGNNFGLLGTAMATERIVIETEKPELLAPPDKSDEGGSGAGNVQTPDLFSPSL